MSNQEILDNRYPTRQGNAAVALLFIHIDLLHHIHHIIVDFFTLVKSLKLCHLVFLCMLACPAHTCALTSVLSFDGSSATDTPCSFSECILNNLFVILSLPLYCLPHIGHTIVRVTSPLEPWFFPIYFSSLFLKFDTLGFENFEIRVFVLKFYSN